MGRNAEEAVNEVAKLLHIGSEEALKFCQRVEDASSEEELPFGIIAEAVQ